MSPIIWDAPLMTVDWFVNPGSDATNPTSLTTRMIRSSEPISARTAASALSAQSRGGGGASTTETRPGPSPTLPVTESTPSTNGNCPDVKTREPVTTAGTQTPPRPTNTP